MIYWKMLLKHYKMIFLLSLVVLALAIILASWGLPKIIQKKIKENVQLDESSLMFEKWRKLPMPLTFKVYLFNVTNPEDVNNGQKPELVEVGPYVYNQYREKRILSYDENDTITYMLQKTFIFNETASGELTELDQLTVINFPYMAALLTIHDMMPAMAGAMNKGLEEMFPGISDPFLRVTVKDLLFDGVFLNCVGNNSALTLICGKLKMDAPPTMRPSEEGNGVLFSMFSHMNISEVGPIKIKRGTDNILDLGQVVSVKNVTSMKVWGDEYCGRINGTDSTIFPPILGSPPDRIYSFEPDLCRSLYVDYVKETSLFDMKAYYYEASDKVLGSKSANPDNKCFCKKNWSANHDGCLIMGILNLMPCQDAPAIASFPHFYLASEELLSYFADGIQADKEKHNSFLFIEPITGVVLSGAKRLQFNIELRNIPTVPQVARVPTGLFPLLWIEEGAELPDDMVNELKQSHKLISNANIAKWCILALAVIFAVSATVVAAKNSFGFSRNHSSISFVMSPGANSVKPY